MINNWSIVLLPIFVSLVYVFFRTCRHEGVRDSLLKTVISFTFFVFASNELLGSFGLLYGQWLQSTYLAAIILFLLFFQNQKVQIFSTLKQDMRLIRPELSHFFPASIGYILLLFLAITLFLAIYIAPNNTDALGYHIARVMFWAQNHNLYHFPTQFSPQLYYNVLSEYFFLQTYLLTGEDYFFNSVHWFAGLISLISVSQFIRICGANKRLQGLTIILTATIPLFILQSSSSQNDLLSACYFSISLYFGYRLFVMKFSFEDYFWGVSALLLAGFTKYSVFIIALPLVLFFAVFQLKENFKRAIQMGMISVGLFALIFSNFFYRNYLLLGDIIKPKTNTSLSIGNYSNDNVNWESFISNLVKIIGNHVALPIRSWNLAYDHFVIQVHAWMNFPLNDPLTTISIYRTSFTIGEDYSGNFVHLILIVLLGAMLLFARPIRKNPHGIFVGLLFLGFCLYTIMFKWQAFHARTQLPLFIAIAPILVYLFSIKFHWIERHIRLISLLLLLQGLPFLVLNSIKPITPLGYSIKKILHYLPSNISAVQSDPKLVDSLIKSKIYQPAKEDRLILSPQLSADQKVKGFQILDSLDVFDQDKYWIGSNDDRFSHYVLYNDKRYAELKSIFKLLGKDRKHIGLVSYSSFISPFFMMGKAQFGDDFRLNYIQYSAIYKGKVNVDTLYSYDAIITDHHDFLAQIRPKAKQVIYLNPWWLILFPKPEQGVYWEK